MIRLLACLIPLLLVQPGNAEELKTLHQKTLYAVGLHVAEHLQEYGIKPEERAYVLMGIEDAMKGDTKVKLSEMNERVRLLGQERRDAPYRAFQEKAAKEPGAKQMPSGLVYKETLPGTGASPKAADTVRAHYHGTLIDGKVFDSSVDRGQPFTSALNRVIPCWTEGMQLMKVGGKARLICPSNIAYGDRGHPPVIPGGATLVFDVELLAVNP